MGEEESLLGEGARRINNDGWVGRQLVRERVEGHRICMQRPSGRKVHGDFQERKKWPLWVGIMSREWLVK